MPEKRKTGQIATESGYEGGGRTVSSAQGPIGGEENVLQARGHFEIKTLPCGERNKTNGETRDQMRPKSHTEGDDRASREGKECRRRLCAGFFSKEGQGAGGIYGRKLILR